MQLPIPPEQYLAALDLLIEQEWISTAAVQVKLGISFSEAGQIVELMIRTGLVGNKYHDGHLLITKNPDGPTLARLVHDAIKLTLRQNKTSPETAGA